MSLSLPFSSKSYSSGYRLTLYYQKEWKMKAYNRKSQAHAWSMVTSLPNGDVAPLSYVHGAANSSALL